MQRGSRKKSCVSARLASSKLFSRQSLIPNCIYLFTNLARDTHISMQMLEHGGLLGIARFTIAIFENFMS